MTFYYTPKKPLFATKAFSYFIFFAGSGKMQRNAFSVRLPFPPARVKLRICKNSNLLVCTSVTREIGR